MTEYIEQLTTFAENGCTRDVKLLLDRGASIDGVDCTGFTSLLLAAYFGHTDCVKLLLDSGASIDNVNGSGYTALMLAANNRHPDCVKLLLDRGAFVDHETPFGCTALIKAIENGHFDTVKLLLYSGASIDKTTNGETILGIAAVNGRPYIIKLLLSFGCLLSAPNIINVSDHFHPLTALGVARRYQQRQRYEFQSDYDEVVDLLECVAGLRPLAIAVGCQLHEEARMALRLGHIDTAGCTQSYLLELATNPNILQDVSEFGDIELNPETIAFARKVLLPWSPETHDLYHSRFREMIRVMHLVEQRLCTMEEPILPHEIWLNLLTFLTRSDWE